MNNETEICGALVYTDQLQFVVLLNGGSSFRILLFQKVSALSKLFKIAL